MTSQAYPQPAMASYLMAFGSAHPASVQAETARGMVCARIASLTTNLNAATNSLVIDPVSLINTTRGSLTRNTSSITAEIYSSIDNTVINTLIEVERRGAEREAQVQTVTESTTHITADFTRARTPRIARPAFAIRPLSSMTRTTNSTIRRVSGETRSLH